MKRCRWLQILLQIHRVHHDQWSYGYIVWFFPFVGWFDDYRVRRIKGKGTNGRGEKIPRVHNCTRTGVY